MSLSWPVPSTRLKKSNALSKQSRDYYNNVWLNVPTTWSCLSRRRHRHPQWAGSLVFGASTYKPPHDWDSKWGRLGCYVGPSCRLVPPSRWYISVLREAVSTERTPTPTIACWRPCGGSNPSNSENRWAGSPGTPICAANPISDKNMCFLIYLLTT